MLVSAFAALVMFAAPETVQATETPAPATKSADAKSAPKKMCYTSTPSGSRMPRKVCVTQAPTKGDDHADHGSDKKAAPKPE